MTDFATVQNVIDSALNQSVGGRVMFQKASITTVAGVLYSGWLAGGAPAAGSIPGAAATVTQATTGALGRFVNPPSPMTMRLIAMEYYQGQHGTDLLYDRLAHMGGLSGTTITPTSQTVNVDIATAAAAGRCASDGSDVEWFIEGYTAPGAATPTVTISYTNQSGTSGRSTTVTMVSALPAGRLIPITVLQSGDTSIKSIQSITLSATMTTAGSFGVTAAKRLCMTNFNVLYAAPANPNGMPGGLMDYLRMKLPKVGPDACLWMVFFASTTSSGNRFGHLVLGGK